MQIVKCKNCGAQLDISRAIGNVVECEYCHSKHTLAKSADVNAVNFLAMGEHELDNGKFDEAYSAYGKAAGIDGSEAEAFFGMALASNKVRYIKDIKNNRLQPICYDATNKSFAGDTNYLKALTLATAEQKAEYVARATEIDYIRSEFYKLKTSGKEYDCFICVKVTGDGGHKTVDSERANDIYYHLKDRGYKPFYSEREIQNETGADYEARILYALFSSPCMFVVCGDESYLQTPWVKNEYTRFISLINDEQKETDSIAIGFFDKPIERLPGRNGRLQGVCLKNPDAYSKIVDFVNNCSPSAKIRKAQAEASRKAQEEELKRRLEEQAELQAKQLEEFKRQQAEAQKELQDRLAALQNNNVAPSSTVSVGGETNVQSLLIRVNQYLDSGDFENAKTYCDRVLDIDPNNGEAWMGLFMASVGAYSPNVLLNKVWEMQFTSSAQVSQQKSAMAFVNAKKYATKYKILLDEVDAVLDNKYRKNLQKEEEERKEQERLKKEEEEKLRKLNLEYEKKKRVELAKQYCTITYSGCLSFCDRNALFDITLPDDVKSIGDGAFSGCSRLKSIEIPNSVTSIGGRAFADCTGLKSIEIPNRVTSIEWGTFEGCFGLTSIGIPSSVTDIGSKAFSGCSRLKSIEIPNSVTDIGSKAFSGCSSITSIFIPKSVTWIRDDAFRWCSGLTSIIVEKGNRKYYSADNCIIETASKKLIVGCKNSVIPTDGSVTSIGCEAFSGRSGLTSIEIPNSVTSIGWEAFSGCEELTIKFNGTKKQWKKIKKLKFKKQKWDSGIRKYTIVCIDCTLSKSER